MATLAIGKGAQRRQVAKAPGRRWRYTRLPGSLRRWPDTPHRAARRACPSTWFFAIEQIPAGRIMLYMLAGARRRAAEQGLGNIEFHQADMQDLPFADAAFDRVTRRFGIMSCPDAARAMAETHRVLRPGGRAAFMVWGPRANTTTLVVFAAAAEAVFGPGPGGNREKAFRLGEAGSLTGPMTAAGFDRVSETDLRFSPEIPTGRPFWLPRQDMMFGARLERATAAEAEALNRAISEGMDRHVRDGAWHLEAHARIVSGERR